MTFEGVCEAFVVAAESTEVFVVPRAFAERLAAGNGVVWTVAACGEAAVPLVSARGCAAGLPGIASAYPPASTTAPATDAAVTSPVVVRTRRSPRSRASARSGASGWILGDNVGLPEVGSESSSPVAAPSLANGEFGRYKPDAHFL